jgi:hypothetical protein
MLRLSCVTLALALGASSSLLAQESPFDLRRDRAPRTAPLPDSSIGVVAPTPEMWFYEQESKRQGDTKLAVRRRAELKGEQRHHRLASMKWYGISNSRPTVSPTPWCGGYSDHWASNTYDPLRWRMPSVPVVVSRPDNSRF